MLKSKYARLIVLGVNTVGVSLLFAGCAASIPVPVVTTNNVIITPAKSQLVPADTPAPPDKQEFLAADKDTRVAMLREDDANVRTSLKNVNDRLVAIQAWIDKEITLYQTTPNTSWVGQAPPGVAASDATAQ